jgi:hypothetical protein
MGSSAFSYSLLDLSPTMTLSGTTNDLSSLRRFFRVRLPTSGMLSHSSSVTTDRPRLRSANCCCILGLSVRCFANSAFSLASLCGVEVEIKQGQRWDRLTRKNHAPSCPPTRVHVLIHRCVDLVRFLVVLLVRSAGEEAILVVWILELVGVYFWLLATFCLRLCDNFCGRTFTCWADI